MKTEDVFEGIRHCLRINESGGGADSRHWHSCPFDKDEDGNTREVPQCQKELYEALRETVADLQNVIKLLEDEK